MAANETDSMMNSVPSARYSSYAGPKRLLHWGPLIAISIILWISSFTIFCDLMYWPIHTPGGVINLSVFVFWVFLVLYFHYQASAIGPGFVTLKWRPSIDADCDSLQFCQVCRGYKAPRSHHCRKCNRCVMKMDHHCPWINSCCGHMNHASFTLFLFFAPIGCMHGLFILVMSLYYGFNVKWYMAYGTGKEPRVIFSLYSLIGSVFAVGLAFGIIISVGILFVIQLKSIIRNRTGIEDWIERKATYRKREKEFVYPYNLGFIGNMRQVFTANCWPRSDGYHWHVRQGCGQYDLTVEQKLQKEQKKQRAALYEVVRAYGGSLFPLTHGLCVCCCFPLSDEPRINIQPGDVISVTRWRKHWLYGDKRIDHRSAGDEQSYTRIRGWFPRHCVRDLHSNSEHSKSQLSKKSD